MSIDRPGRTARHPALRDIARLVVVRRLPGRRLAGSAARRGSPTSARSPHGTTIVAAIYADGVVMAGDRRATAGNLIAQRDIEKVFAADDYTLVGIAGVAGLAIEIVRLYQVELEHYEKIEGTQLTLDGKANRLGDDDPRQPRAGDAGPGGRAAVRRLRRRRAGRRRVRASIFSFDVTGGRYPEQYYHCVGSGSLFARGALKKLWRPGLSTAPGRPGRRRGALRRRRRRLGHRRPGHHPRHLPGGAARHGRRAPSASATTSSAASCARSSPTARSRPGA